MRTKKVERFTWRFSLGFFLFKNMYLRSLFHLDSYVADKKLQNTISLLFSKQLLLFDIVV